ncbi:MAG: peptide deformylase [Acidobacteriota bacterium]
MAILDIRTYPDPVLREKAAPVEKVDEQLRRLIADMVETMYEAPGVGLAANQVGIPIQLLVIDIQKPDDEHGLIVLINPEIVSASGQITFEEGCLSIPGYFTDIKRFSEVTVRGLDQNEEPVEINASGFLAVALQHEIDHLEGKLFIDRMGAIARDIFKRRWKKQAQKQQVREATA